MSSAALDTDSLRELVARLFPGSSLKKWRPLEGGYSSRVTLLQLEDAAGEMVPLVLRQYDRQSPSRILTPAEVEFKLLERLSAFGLPTPEPIHLDLSGTVLQDPYLLSSFLPGEMDFRLNDLGDAMAQFAKELARIHQITPVTADLSFLTATGSCPETAGTDPAAETSPLPESSIRASLAAAGPPSPKNPPSLLHGDYWPGNVLWQEGELTAVIDWEDASVGDPLIDVARSRSELAWVFGHEWMQAFTLAYRSMRRLDWTQLPYWDLCACLRMARWLVHDIESVAGYFAQFGRHDIRPEQIWSNLRAFAAQALRAMA